MANESDGGQGGERSMAVYPSERRLRPRRPNGQTARLRPVVGSGSTAVEQAALRSLRGPIHLRVSPPTPEQPQARPLPDWPTMMSRDQLCDYVGVSWSTLKGIFTVPPVDLGASVIRYRRDQIDEWVRSRPSRPDKARQGPQARPATEAPAVEASAPDSRLLALERARQRAQGR